MNTRTFTFCIAALAACAPAIAAEPSPTQQHSPLYIHVIGPNPHFSETATRLLTLRVRCSEEIELVAAGSVISLKGRIEPRGTKFFAHLTTRVGLGTEEFTGEVELDKPFSTAWVSGSDVSIFYQVLSRDPKAFFKDPLWKAPENNDKKPK